MAKRQGSLGVERVKVLTLQKNKSEMGCLREEKRIWETSMC